VEIRAKEVTLKPPKNSPKKSSPLKANIVLVEEVDVPAGMEPARWALLTRESIATLPEVLRVINIYIAKWLIEEFHMGLKTGCSIEDKQFETRPRLENILGISSMVACRLLQIRDICRSGIDVPATEVLTTPQIEILQSVNPKLSTDCTIQQALPVIAQLGGFRKSKKNSSPGWRTLWRGFTRLLEREEGYKIAKAMSQMKNEMSRCRMN
jgi:hypothetical protein